VPRVFNLLPPARARASWEAWGEFKYYSWEVRSQRPRTQVH